MGRAQVAQISLRVSVQVGAGGQPQVLLPSARVVIQHDPAYLPSFPDARAVADHEPGSAAVGENLAVFLTRVGDALELQFRELPAVDDVVGDRVDERVRRGRERDGRERRRLRDVPGVFDAALWEGGGARGCDARVRSRRERLKKKKHDV